MQLPKIDDIKHLLIIGNGFDIDLGLKTKYSDFLDSEQFRVIAMRASPKPNYLAGYLQKNHETAKKQNKNWVDIEQSFAVYSKGIDQQLTPDYQRIDRPTVEANYEEIKDALTKYILTQNDKELDQNSNAFNLVHHLASYGGLNIIDFNYTNSVERICADINQHITHVHVHGSAVSSGIVFGVQDSAEIHRDHNFFLKGTSDHLFADWQVSRAMKEAKLSISIFGHSLGISDTSQFGDFFASNDGIQPKGIDIYHHDDESKSLLYKQIEIMTNRRLQDFRFHHDFRMINSGNLISFDSI